MAQGKPLQTLYQSLKDNNYDVPETYDSFERTLTLPGNDGMNNRRALYEALRDDNYDVPDTYEVFANTLFAPAQKANPVQAAEEVKTGGDQMVKPAPSINSNFVPTLNVPTFEKGSFNPYNKGIGGVRNPIMTNPMDAFKQKTQPKVDKTWNKEMVIGVDENGNKGYVLQEKPVEDTGVIDGVNEKGEYVSQIVGQEGSLMRQSDEFKQAMGDEYERRMTHLGEMSNELAQVNSEIEEMTKNAYKLGVDPEAWKRMNDAQKREAIEKYKADQAQRRQQLEDRRAELKSEIASLTQGDKNLLKANLDELEEKLNSKEEAIRQKMKYAHDSSPSISSPYGGLGSGSSVFSQTPKSGSGYEKYMLTSANHNIRETRKLIEAAEANADGDQNFFVGAFGGFMNAVLNERTWDYGLGDMADYFLRKGIIDKYDKEEESKGGGGGTGRRAVAKLKKGEQLTEAEDLFLKSIMIRESADMLFGGDLSRGFKAGRTTGEALPFMLEMYLNPLGSGAKTATSAVGRMSKMLMGAEKARRLATNFARMTTGGKTVFRRAVNNLAKNAVLDADAVIRSTGMSLTSGLPKVVGGTVKDITGNIRSTYDDKGNIQFAGTEDEYGFWDALGKNVYEVAKENATEMGIGPVGAMYRGGKYVLSRPIAKLGKTLGDTGTYRAIIKRLPSFTPTSFNHNMNHFLKRTQWHGTFGEYWEEVEGNVLDGIMSQLTGGRVGGDVNFKLDLKDENSIFNLDNNIDTFLGVGLMGGFTSAVSTFGYRKAQDVAADMISAADAEGMEAFNSTEGWENYKLQLNQLDPNKKNENGVSEVTSFIINEMQNGTLTDKQKKAVFDYLHAKEFAVGVEYGAKAEIAEMDAAIKEEVNKEVEASATQEHTPEDIHETVIDEGEAAVELSSTPEGQYLKDMIDLMVGDGASEGELSNLLAGVDEQTADAAERYIQAKAKNKGVDIQTENNVQSAVEAESDRISQFVYNDEGESYLIPVTYRGRNGYAVAFEGENVVVKFEDNGEEKIFLDSDEDLNVGNTQTVQQYMDNYTQLTQNEVAGAVEAARVNNPRTKVEPQVGDVIDTTGGQKRVASITDGKVYLEEPLDTMDKEGNIVPKHPATFSPEDIVAPEEFVRMQNEFYDGEDRAAKDAEKAVEAEAVANVENEEVAPVEQPQPVEEKSGDEMPMMEVTDKKSGAVKQKPDFATAGAERSYNYIYNERGLERNDANAFVNNNLEAAQKKLEALQGKPVKMGTDLDEFEERKSKWQADVDAAQKDVDMWQNIKKLAKDDMLEQQREEAEAAKANKKVSELGEPLSMREWIMRALFNGGYKFDWEDDGETKGLGSHLGFSNSKIEKRKRRWMIGKRNEGALSPEKMAERMLNAYATDMGWEGTEGDWAVTSQDVLNELLDIVASNDRKSEMGKKIVQEHNEAETTLQTAGGEEVMSKEEEEYLKDNFAKEMGFTSYDEYESYLGYAESDQQVLDDAEWNELQTQFAEEYEKESVSLQRNEQLNTEDNGEGTNLEGNEGSSVVVPETGQARAEGNAVGSEEQGGIQAAGSESSGDLSQGEGTGSGVSDARSVQGLDGYSADEVLNAIRGEIEMRLDEAGLSEDVIIKDMALNGSRMRGDARDDSDLDVVVEYEGDISEDALFNILHETPIEIEGIKVDINPITKGKSGTIAEFLKRNAAYDEEKKKEADNKLYERLDALSTEELLRIAKEKEDKAGDLEKIFDEDREYDLIGYILNERGVKLPQFESKSAPLSETDPLKRAEQIEAQNEPATTDFENETMEEWQAFEKRVPKMSDEELLGYIEAQGETDYQAAHSSVYDEYDERHRDEYLERVDYYKSVLDDMFDGVESGVEDEVLERVNEMQANAQLQWEDGGYYSPERTALLAQMDAIDEWIDEFMNREQEPLDDYNPVHRAEQVIEREKVDAAAQKIKDDSLLKSEVDVERARNLRQALADAYAAKDPAAIKNAIDAIKAYRDEGLDFEQDYNEAVDDYEGDNPMMLADKYIIHAYQDAYLDDDEDQEYIKTGLTKQMRGEAAPYIVGEKKAVSPLQMDLFSDMDFKSVWDEFQEQNSDDSLVYSQILERRNTSPEEARDIRDKIVERFKQNPSAQERKRMIAQLEAVNPYIEFVERELQELENDKKRDVAINEKEQNEGVTEPTQIRLRPLEEGESSYVERRYVENGFFDFTGTDKIESIDDVAYIFKQLQNVSMENGFIVLVKDGVPTVIHVGMGSYMETMLDGRQAFVAFRDMNPDKVYIVHNHPSGYLKCSKQDKELYANMHKLFGDKLEKGIIIDTTSGKYGLFDELADYPNRLIDAQEKAGLKSYDNVKPIKVYTFSKTVFDPEWNPDTAFKSSTAADVAKFVSSHRLGEHKKLSLLILTNNHNIAGNVFLPWTSLKDAANKDGASLIAYYMNQMGGNAVILYGSTRDDDDVKSTKTLQTLLKNNGVRLMDMVRVAENQSDYESMAEKGLMEPEAEFGTKPEAKEDEYFNAYNNEQETVNKRGGLVKNDAAERSMSPYWRGALHALGRLIGRRVVVLSGEDIAKMGYDPKSTKGLTVGNSIYLNEEKFAGDAEKLAFLHGHEITHILKKENPELWNAYVEAVKVVMGKAFTEEFTHKRLVYDAFYDAYNRRHPKTPLKKLTDAQIEEEICCDWSGRNVLTDEEAVKRIIENAEEAGADPVSLTQKILDYIKQWIADLKQALKNAVGNKEEISKNLDLAEKAKKLWQDMYNVAVARQNAKMEAAEAEESSVRFSLVYDPIEVARLESEPKETGYRNVVLNQDGTLGSPMADRLGKKGEKSKRTSSFEMGRWEKSDEHPEMATDDGKIDLVKPDNKKVGGVDYNPYIHIRPTLVNKQFKQAWERPNLVYVETLYPTSELTSGYQAEKAKKAVGMHDWNGGKLILSRYDKPMRIVPWEEVADDWVKEFKDSGVNFDIVPPALLPILSERGVEILPPHKGMGKECVEAYEEWLAAKPQGTGGVMFSLPEEEKEIVERSKKDGSYMKAPNGEPTKLNEKQWVQVRTQNFKNWFGDWEKKERVEKLRTSEDAVITGDEIPITDNDRENKKNALAYGKTLQGSYTNKDTGNSIQLQRGRKNGGVNEVLQHNYKDEAHLKSVAAIPQIIEKSIYISSVENRDKEKNPDVTEYQHYVCGLKIGNEDYTVHALVAVDKNGDRYYDHNLVDIEKGKLLDHISGKAVVTGFGSTPDTKSTTNSGRKVNDLISILQENSSKIVDKNGEPLVVYHGTGSYGFNTFKERREWNYDVDREEGVGIFFSSDKDNSTGYEDEEASEELGFENTQKGTYSVFLNIKNPLVVDFDGAWWNGRKFTYEVKNDEGKTVKTFSNLQEAKDYTRKQGDGATIENVEVGSGVKRIDKYVTEARQKGYDGVIIKNVRDSHLDNHEAHPATTYVVFKPNQIKSATDNNGEFSAENDDIRFSLDEEKMREERRDSEESKKIFDAAKKLFGVTQDIREAGYVLPDGSMLDFSGRHLLNKGSDSSFLRGRRTTDHREISSIAYESDGWTKTGLETSMPDFIERGAIRIDDNAGTINLFMKPTNKQKEALRRLVARNDGDVTVDFGNGWDTEHDVEYTGAKPMRVLSDIDKYFDDGIKPESDVVMFSLDDNEPFYSNAEKAVTDIKQEKATPEQWLKMIEKNGGLKAGEDKWLGLSEWLKEQNRNTDAAKKTLTKDEVLDYIRKNEIEIYDETYAADADVDNSERMHQLKEEFDELMQQGEEATNSIYTSDWADWAFDQMVDQYGDDFREAFEIDDDANRYPTIVPTYDYDGSLTDVARYFLDINDKPINSTRMDYTTEGLDNKREIALVVPTIEPWNEGDQIHFGDAGEGRAVAWVRFGDTTTNAKGGVSSTAIMDELEKKYDNVDDYSKMTDEDAAKRAFANYLVRDNADVDMMKQWLAEDVGEDRAENVVSLFDKLVNDNKKGQRVLVIDEIQSKRHQEGRENGYYKQGSYEKSLEDFQSYIREMRAKYGEHTLPSRWTEEEQGEYDRLRDENNRLYDVKRKGIPDAPFEKNWHELAMKRMLRYAAENGYDKVAWTKGEQQAERYNIGDVVSSIDVTPYEAQSPSESDGHDLVMTLNDGTMHEMFVQPDGTLNADSEMFNGKKVSEVFGKGLAEKIMSANEPTGISGDGLRIGGEGMKGFYDQILPRFMDKYGKKWGVKTGEVELPNLEESAQKMWAVDVTPEMKESVMQGQPMFSLADEALDEYDPVKRAEQVMKREKVAKVRGKFDELSKKYNGKKYDAIPYKGLSDEALLDVLGAKGELRRSAIEEMEDVRKYFDDERKKSFYNPFTDKILIFADRIKEGGEEEAFFHENVHGILQDWYGEGKRSIAERFWDAAPDEGLSKKEFVKKNYHRDLWKEELFTHWLGKAMVKGRVDEVLNLLNKEDKQRVNNILNILGYDKEEENARRAEENGAGLAEQAGVLRRGRGESDADSEQVMFSLDDESSEEKKPSVRDTGYNEVLTKARLDNAQKNKDDVDARIRAMKSISGNLSQLRRAMSIQRDYDRKTVDRIVKLARMVMDTGFIDELSRGEVKKLLGLVNGAAGKEDISQSAKKVVDMLVNHQLRECENLFAKQLSTKAKKIDAKGVEIQGKLDIEGQRMLAALKDGIKMRDKELEQRIAEAEDDLDSENAVVRKNAAIELQGLMLAKQYQESILASEEEERELKKDLRKFREQFYDYETEEYEYEKGRTRKREVHHVKPEYKRNPRVQDAIRQFEDEYDVNLSENHVQRIEDYFKLLSAVGGNISESIERAKEWIESEKKRVNEIHHHANSDLEGISARSQTKEKTKGLSTDPIVRAILSPMASFEKMMRFFGRKSPNGEGYLFDDFVRGQLWASDKEWRSKQEALKELGEKAKELFGGKFEKVTDLYKLNNDLPTIPVEYWDEGERVEDEISQLEALYLYMANKMKDGKMKLRAMGISEEDIETIKNHIEPRLIQFADWVQSEFLPKRREYYNEVYNRLNGADMAAIDEYFPLKIQQGSISKSDDITEKGRDKKASTMVGSYIKRTKNAKPLDIHSNAISVLMEHIDDMEHISAWGEFNRDLNTLINYKRFENRVKNMDSVEFGTGKQLWNDLVKAAQVVTNSYSSNIGKIDRAVLNIAKGATSAAIVGRVWTAIKQLSSIPAWWNGEASVQELAKATKDIVKTWKWGMENLPTFSKRWESRKVGEIRLEDSEDDYSIWKNKAISWLNRSGMKPNAFFDALACVAGAKAVYETKKKRYLDDGYSADKADKKALEDAAIAFNNSQQSAESAYLAPVQKDRSVASVMTTVFRTSPIGYTRRLFSSMRTLRNMSKKGYKEGSIEYLKKKMVREGLSEEQAKQAANKEYSRARNKAIADVALFGYLLPLAWNLFKVAPYLFMGDDDDKKWQYFEDAAVQALLFGPIEGLAGGNILSELGINIYHALRHDESLMSALTNDYAELPVFSEAKRVIRSFNKDVVAGAVDLVSLLTQVFVGANPKVIIDGLAAILDYAQGDMWTAREIALLLMKIAQVPQSQLDEIYIDEIGMSAREAQHLRIEEVAKRYINYKENRETAFLSNVYPEDYKKEVDDKWMGKVKNSLKARLLLQSDADIEKGLIQASPGMEQDIYEKELLRRIDVNVEGYSPAELAEAYNNAELQPVRKRLAKEISKDAGASRDPYGSQTDEEVYQIYQELRTAKDIEDDALLLAEQEKARDAGNEQRKKAISEERSRVMGLRKGLGFGKDEDVMKTLRKERFKLLEKYVYKKD